MALLEIKHITKTFQDVCALQDITCSFDKGIYGLIGANGAGKSTLFKILTTSLIPDEGEILYQGTSIQQLKQEYRSHIGYMPQNQKGYGQLSAYQFLYYIAALKGLKNNETKRQIIELAEKVHLENDLHRKIKNFSGGMRQRLLFMQALLGNPDILILDEPTAGLDPYERIIMRNHIFDISHNKTVIIATHVMQDIEYIADEILLLKKGKLIFQGKSELLIEQMEGYVHEKQIALSELENYQKQYQIVRMIRVNKGIRIRYLSNEKQEGSVGADLEDVYLHTMIDS
ncbi:ATP-binding cassette domain-containing protein [Absiella sp. AM29-15]|uniref:ATP-binding cassette domain-containing protein n=1 Tax=Absiella sp. AM29-15 TaxID=2292278 RepID=UPI001314CB59|nr:ATP-binding cassette domain-containing protein [Absiella sp. AM29-15]